MNGRISPTREQYLSLRRQREVIGKGMGLLKSKREALMKEFFGIVEESVELRSRLTALLASAQRRLEIARAFSPMALESYSFGVRRDVPLEIKVRNIWGVFVPEIEDITLSRGLGALDISPIGESPSVVDVSRGFEEAADLIVKIASKEIRLVRLGEVIRADTRKINAISEVMLPSMDRSIKEISRVLEEHEREEIFRLKRTKGRREGADGQWSGL